VFHFPNGLADFLAENTQGLETVTPEPFAGRVERKSEAALWNGPWPGPRRVSARPTDS